MTDYPPTCPLCGDQDSASRINHPDGQWYCGCGTLFDGTDGEWRRWARHRREAIERRAGNRPPLKLVQRPMKERQ